VVAGKSATGHVEKDKEKIVTSLARDCSRSAGRAEAAGHEQGQCRPRTPVLCFSHLQEQVMADQESKPAERKISIQKIYLKDFSFESPQTPQVFTEGKWDPKTNLNLRSTHSAGYGEFHEVVLTLTVETKHEDKTLFLIELQQAGLFQIAGYTEQEFAAVVGSFCPNLLFPYAREAISGIVSRGGFPELLLQPINFDALYAQSRAELQNRAAQQSVAEAKAGNGGDSH
jgi:preprotein translocase subunit SecB